MFDAIENNGKYTRSVESYIIILIGWFMTTIILLHCLQMAGLGTADHNVCPGWWTLLHLSIV